MATPTPKDISERAMKMCFCLIFVSIILTLSNKRNKVSGGHDPRSQGGGSRHSPGGEEHE